MRYSGAPPMPLIAGRRSSIGPGGISSGCAPGGLERERMRLVRIADAKGEPARRGPVLGGEVAGVALRLAVDDEVDVALAEQDDVLRAVPGDEAEAELL